MTGTITEGSRPETALAEPHPASSALSAWQAPFKTFTLPPYRRLAELNRTMPDRARLDPIGWTLEMAGFAFWAEALDTARGLLDVLSASRRRFNEAQLRRYLPLAADILLAFGEQDTARALLLEYSDVTLSDDRLTSMLVSLRPDDQDGIREADFWLPSGRLNAFYAAPRAHLAPGWLRRLHESIEPAASELLVLANALRFDDRTGWLNIWNRFLGMKQLPLLSDAHPGSDRNVLSTLRFAADDTVPDGPLISIVMACRNAAGTLSYALESVLGQSWQNIEVLICDDASTDETPALLGSIDDPRVRVFRSNAQQGPYNIRNALIARATGDYITFADADDVALPDRIAHQFSVLQQNKTEACVGRWVRVRPDGETVFFRDQNCERLCVVSLFGTRSFFETQGPYREALCGADSEIYERARGLGEDGVLLLDRILVLGLWSQQSLTRTQGVEALNDGYRSAPRRAFSEMAARQRVLGKEIVTDLDVTAALAAHGIYMAPSGIAPLVRSAKRRPRKK